jgi:hypothetical protein
LRPPVATLCDVVGQVRDHHARQASHRGRLREKSGDVNFVHCHRYSRYSSEHKLPAASQAYSCRSSPNQKNLLLVPNFGKIEDVSICRGNT